MPVQLLTVNPMLLKAREMGFVVPPRAKVPSEVAGRLASFVDTWKVLTKDTWVLDAIQGYHIPFSGKPYQPHRPQEGVFSQEQTALMKEEVDSLLQKAAISSCPNTLEGFYSTLFLVPKKNGQMRPVINLKQLNKWVETPHFKMEGIQTLRDLLRTGDWMVKVDLKDAYFTVPIHRTHQQYLRFQVAGVCYQFTCLPFGLSCAPWTFTKVMKPLMTLLRSWGVRIIVYIDDMLILANSKEEAIQHLEVLLFLLEALGFMVNSEKSHLSPSQEIEFLGLQVDSQNTLLRLPGEKLRLIRKEAIELLQKERVSARHLSQFIGKLNAASQAILVAPLFYRALQGDLQRALTQGCQNYNRQLALSPQAKEELGWWQTHLTHWNGRTTLRRPIQITIQSDASLAGWGAVCSGVKTGGSWTPQEREMHINCLELLATELAMKSFIKDHRGVSVLLQLDNSTAVAYINNLGGTVSPLLTSMARSLWLWALERDIVISAQHIPGVSNTTADLESRVERDRSDWMLVPAVFQKINQIFGPLEIDLFASRLTHQLPRFFSWRPDPQAEAVDAFQQDWSQLRGYANPPWCLVGRVLNKVRTQQAQLVLVAPVWRGQSWYPVLLGMLREFPRLLSPQQAQMQRGGQQRAEEFTPQLAVWPVSGKNSETVAFQQRLLTSCWHPGGRSPHKPTTPCSTSGLAGVLNGIVIPFLAL